MSQCQCLPGAVAVALLVAVAGASAGEIVVGRVVGVSDGDTITVLDPRRQQFKVRLAMMVGLWHHAHPLPPWEWRKAKPEN